MTYVLTDEEKSGFQAATKDAKLIWDLDIHLYPFYSGRNMYGEKCFGVVVDSASSVYYALGFFAASHQKLSMELMNCHVRDNLGKDYIVYFPGYLWEEEK